MSRTITALFDTRADAEAGRQRLLAADLDADNVRIHDQASVGSQGSAGSHASVGSQTGAGSSTAAETGGDTGMWGSIKNAFLPDEDRHTYDEGVRRGGFLLSADVDEDEIERAVAALEDANSVDIDKRLASWRQDGWNAPQADATTRPALFDRDRSADDASIPIVEEQLVVGKREVERGGTRLRSYVTEVPVHEQVRLRRENVEVERRPVNRALNDGDPDAFRERSIEMTETNEEAVVGKTARVVEEVSLKKSTDERVEDINDTVRKTEVEVEDLSGVDRTMTSEATTTGTGAGDLGVAGGSGRESSGNRY